MSSTTTPASIPVARKEIFGWAMFDFANSSYTTVIITAVYSSYFIETVVPAGSRARDIWWSAAMVASTLIALVLSPLAGAICDKKGSKKPYLLASTLTCALSTAALALVGPGDVYLAVFLIAEGLLPLLAPRAWREMFQRVMQFKDGQLRFFGMASVLLGVLLLWV